MRPLLLLALVAGCSTEPDSVTLTVDDTTVFEIDGLTLTVPAGAVPAGTEITITRTDDAPPMDLIGASAVWQFEPDGLEFSEPATVSMPFDATTVADPELYWTNELGDFYAIDAVVDGDRMVGSIDHFSQGFVGGSVVVPTDTGTPHDTAGPIAWHFGADLGPTFPMVVNGQPKCEEIESHHRPFYVDDTASVNPVTPPPECDNASALVAGVGFPSIEEAVEAAASGETVQVCPGIHLARLVIDKDLTIEGIDPDAQATVLTATMKGKIIDIDGDLTLRNLTLRRGFDSQFGEGGGAIAGRIGQTGNTLVIQNVRFEQNLACSLGGAVNLMWFEETTIIDSEFLDNVSGDGGGAIYHSDQIGGTTVSIASSHFENNASDDGGGAVEMAAGTVADSTFVNNRASDYAGALSLLSQNLESAVVERSHFESNYSRKGGAVRLYGYNAEPATISNATFVRNAAPDGGGAVLLGGQSSTFSLDQCVLDDNQSRWKLGSAVYLDGGVLQLSDSTITNHGQTALAVDEGALTATEVDMGEAGDDNDEDVAGCSQLDGVSSFSYDPGTQSCN